MEKNRPRSMQERGCLFPIDMSARVTQITRLHNLAEAHSLLGSDREAELYRNAAVDYGVCIITLTEHDKGQKKALNEALEWLRERDYEMHKTVVDTFEQARAKRILARRAKRVTSVYGNHKRRAA